MQKVKKKRIKNGIVTTFALLFVALLSISLAAYFTGGFSLGKGSFIVSVGDTAYRGDVDNVSFRYDTKYQIKVRNLKEPLQAVTGNAYRVRVLPKVAPENDFTFIVDGIEQLFSAEKTLTMGFDIVISNNYFEFRFPETMTEVLQRVYVGKEISGVPVGADINVNAYFQLRVDSLDGITISIDVKPYTAVKSIQINKEFLL